MADQIKVSVEIDKLRAEQSIRDLSRQLSATDNLINQMRKSGITWADTFKKATSQVRDEIDKVGLATTKATNKMIQGNKAFASSLDNIAAKVKNVSAAVQNAGKNFLVPLDASKAPVTASLRDDNAKRRAAYFNKIQAGYQKEQEALRRYNEAMKKKTATDKASAQSSQQVATAMKRVGVAALSQSGAVNKLSASWKLAKQNMRESISVANLFQTSARALTGVIGGLVFKFAEFVKLAPSLASDMLGFRNALELVTGSQAEASGLLGTAIGIATKLKLSIVAVTKEYSKFINSATIAGLTVQKATDTFTNFAIAARVLNLSQQRTSGMFLALEQMISKGRVSMEELRRQLGEHIPGALNLAAQAMGYGTNELGKFIKEVSNGNVVSIELVQKLGELVKNRTINQLPGSLQKFSAAAQDLANAFTELGIKLGHLMSLFLVPLTTFLANTVRAFADWAPEVNLVGEASVDLGDKLNGVKTAATAVNTTLQTITSTSDAVAAATETAAMQLEGMQEDMNAVSIAGIAMLGTVGTAGLGGAFAALGKAAEWVKKGLKNFAAPFILLGSKLKPIIALIGAGGLTKAVFSLRLAFQSLLLTIQATLARLAVLALMNPFLAITAGIAAATAALYLYLDANNDLDDINQTINEQLTANAEKTKILAEEFGQLGAKMTDLGEADLAVDLTLAEQKIKLLQKQDAIDKKAVKHAQDQLRWTDLALKSIGYKTDKLLEAERASAQLALNMLHTAMHIDRIETANLDKIGEANIRLEEEESVKSALAWLEKNKDSREIEFKIKSVGVEGLAAKLKEIDFEYNNLIDKANIEFSGPAFDEEEASINNQRELAKELAIALDGYKNLQKIQKEFESGLKSLNSTIESSQLNLEQQAMTIGKTGYELDQLNTQFKIAALEQKALELETKATTAAQREQVAAIRQQIATVGALSQNLNLLKEQERLRVAAVKDGQEETKKRLELMKQGHEALGVTISLEQQFAKRMQELKPALQAVGASQAQVRQVMQQEWRLIVDNADNGLKSMQTLSEEFAKGMQENFSNFFFDIMEGNFDNLADGFTSMLNRMVAEAIATNLAKYIMGPGGGGDMLSSIFGSNIGSALFNTAPSMPTGLSSAGGTMAMGSGSVNIPGLAYGGNFEVPGTGGTDSQIVAFKATPGEQFQAIPPSKQGYQEMGSNGGGPTILNFNVTTPDANSFNASRPQMEVELRQMVQNAGRNV